MTTELFRQRLGRVQVHPDDLKWMPKWLDEYARLVGSPAGPLPVSSDSVLNFLRSLRDRAVPAWQRQSIAMAFRMGMVGYICPLRCIANIPTPIGNWDGRT